MTPTVTQVLETAKALPREGRAELAEQLLATLGTPDESYEVRLTALKEAVNQGLQSLDAGYGIDIPPGGLRDYLRERGRLATERVKARAA